METVRIGVIGAGNMGSLHARVAADSQGVALLGIFDTDAARVSPVAERLGAVAYSSAEELIAAADAIIVAAPSIHHHQYAMQCIESGTPVLIEKPVATTVADAEDLARAAQDAEVVAHVGHIERFNPTFGELARVLGGRTIRSLAFRRISPHTPQAQDIDVTLDLMIHDLDLAFSLTGSEMTTVSAVAHRIAAAQPDFVTATLGLANGVSAVFTASKASFDKVRIIEAHTDDATIRADLLTREVWVHQRLDDSYRETGTFVTYQQQTVIERIFAAPIEPLRAEHRAFVEAVRGGQDRGVGVLDGARALAAALAVVSTYSS